MIANPDCTENLCAGTDVDMTTDLGGAGLTTRNRDLLKYQTINAYFSLGMDNDPVRMRDQQAAAYVAIKVYQQLQRSKTGG